MNDQISTECHELMKSVLQLLIVIFQSPSPVWLFAMPGTTALQVLLSMGFSRQEYWSGLPFHSPRDLPGSGIKPSSPALVGRFFTTKHQGSPQLLGRPLKHWRRKWQPTPVFLPGESQGPGSLVGSRLWGRTEWTRLKRLSSSSS